MTFLETTKPSILIGMPELCGSKFEPFAKTFSVHGAWLQKSWGERWGDNVTPLTEEGQRFLSL